MRRLLGKMRVLKNIKPVNLQFLFDRCKADHRISK